MKRVLGAIWAGGFLFVACGDDGDPGSGATAGNAGQGKAGNQTSAGKGSGGGAGSSSVGGKQGSGGVPSLAGESTGGTGDVAGDSSTGGSSAGGTPETSGGSSEGGAGVVDPGGGGGGQVGAGEGGAGGAALSPCHPYVHPTGQLLISEIRWRGVASSNDDFIELYNSSPQPITLDATWTIEVRSDASASYTLRWTGASQVLQMDRHFLIVGSASTVTGDASLTSNITDSASVVLKHNGTPVDAVCYECGTPGKFDGTYTCQGAAVGVGTCAEAVDRSIEREPGGAAGNCIDTDGGAADWANIAPSSPQNMAAPVTPTF